MSMPTRRELLAELGLPPDADSSSIKRRYRELAKALHPDVNPATEAGRRFAAATDAYRRLIEREHATEDSGAAQGPAMDARWNIRRRHKPTEYPAWFDPAKGSRSMSMSSRAGVRAACTCWRASSLRRAAAVVSLLQAWWRI